jgi:NUMOD3 motif
MNQYLEIIRNLSLQNSSTQEYVLLCEGALSRLSISGYIEKHHILPKCMCEDDLQIRDDNNLVKFSAKEHFIAHALLAEMFEGNLKKKMQKGLSMMLADRMGNRILTSEEYEIARIANSESKKGVRLAPFTEEHKRNMSLSRKGKPRSKESCEKQSKTTKGRALTETQIKEYESRIGNWVSPMKGKNHSEDSKEKMSKKRKGVEKSLDHCKNISISLTGRIFSNEHLKNMSISAKTKPKVICEHCGLSMIKSNYTKWHGGKCKLKQSEVKGDV